MKPASRRNHVLFLASMGALWAGCAHTPSATEGAPQGQCMRLVGLDDQGLSLIRESGGGQVRYHLQQHGPKTETETITEAECRLRQLCDEQGPKLEAQGLLPAERFEAGQTAAPGEVTLEVPGLGRQTLSFAPREDRFGEAAWTLAIDRDDPWVLYRAAPSLKPTQVRWYRAGSYLWLQLDTAAPAVACLAVAVDLDQAGASVLNGDAVKALRAGRYDEAEALLSRAIKVATDDEAVAYNLACTYALKGDDARALQWLEDAFRMDPDGRLRAQAPKDQDLERLWSNDVFLQLVAGG